MEASHLFWCLEPAWIGTRPFRRTQRIVPVPTLADPLACGGGSVSRALGSGWAPASEASRIHFETVRQAGPQVLQGQGQLVQPRQNRWSKKKVWFAAEVRTKKMAAEL